MIIRQKKKGDLEDILDIVKILKKWFEPEVPLNIKRTYNNQKGFVAVKKDKIVGFILYKIWKHTGEIKWLGVNPYHRRSGIGSIILKTAENDMMKKGVKDVTVGTLASTIRYKPYAATRKFYSRHGYRKLRIDKKYWKKKYDRLVVIKEL